MSLVKCLVVGPNTRIPKLDAFKQIAGAQHNGIFEADFVRIPAVVEGKEYSVSMTLEANVLPVDVVILMVNPETEYPGPSVEPWPFYRQLLNIQEKPVILVAEIGNAIATEGQFYIRKYSKLGHMPFFKNTVTYMECSVIKQTGARAIVDTAIRAVTDPNMIKQTIGNLNNMCLTNHDVVRPNYVKYEILRKEIVYLGENNLKNLTIDNSIKLNVVALYLFKNAIVEFPNFAAPFLQFLDLSYNHIATIPLDFLQNLPALKWLNIENNKLDDLPYSASSIDTLKVAGNPLSKILPAYRYDVVKLMHYLQMIEKQIPIQPWNQIKLMIVGQEGVGKTTLVHKLQDSKFKCNTNISTDGVNISIVELPHPSNSFFGKKEYIKFNIWDFGGQAVYHSTHRLFITSLALYLILYDMSKPATIDRIKYWIEQIIAIPDTEKTKPILIVGTHADKLKSKQEQTEIEAKIRSMYPIGSRTQIYGHFTLSTVLGETVELHSELVDLALNHPTIGIGKVKVPHSFTMLLEELQAQKNRGYIKWAEYTKICNSIGIIPDNITVVTTLLHDTGLIVWHNIHKLRDIVVINPQWLADALSGVVTFMQASVSNDRGMTNWARMRESLTLKFKDAEMHQTILALLEFFEIIYKMQITRPSKLPNMTNFSEEQMFFVPSLLAAITEQEKAHLSIQYWNRICPRRQYNRQFAWSFYPAGFFPCLLLRLAHLRVCVLASWLDTAVIMGKDGTECALLQLEGTLSKYILKICVKVESDSSIEEPLIAELAYVTAKLHHDMYTSESAFVPLVHHIIASVSNINNETVDMILCFEDCVQEQTQGHTYHDILGVNIRLDELTPDLSGCTLIPSLTITKGAILGSGTYGKVYKGMWTNSTTTTEVALKELVLDVPENVQLNHYEQSQAIYNFQHEITVMSKLNHVNILRLYGILQSPLLMVLEYIPNKDLHHVLETPNSHTLSLKWRLKLAIDCASGMKYLHYQHPPICHSDLRAPNVFIASMDENSDVIGKVADFGLSQQIFPHAQQKLGNETETAPETWLDMKFYDHRADVFSFAVILWRIFGAKMWYNVDSTSDDAIEPLENAQFLRKGHVMNGHSLRTAIRAGARYTIHKKCPEDLQILISSCWATHPEERPSFRQILNSLMAIYIKKFIADRYIVQKQNESHIISKPIVQNNNMTYLQEFTMSSFDANSWIPINFTEATTVTSIVQAGMAIWMGLSNYLIYVIDAKTREIIQQISPSAMQVQLGAHTRGVQLLKVGYCMWAGEGNILRVFSLKTWQELTSHLRNYHTITCMEYIPHLHQVWIADAFGFISVWDAKTIQKCHRFQIHTSNCVQTMATICEFMWMGVGRDLIAVQTKNKQMVTFNQAHTDRIYNVVAVLLTNQVWTSGRDRALRVCRLEKNEGATKSYTIKMVHEIRLNSPLKSLCTMSDGVHICGGSFDGSIFMWDIERFHQIEIPAPSTMQKKSIQCMLDTDDFLWCGVELATEAVQCHPHTEPKAKFARQNCHKHRSSHHDFFISYCVSSELVDSELAPVKVVYESLSKQKKKSGEPVLVFWDIQCLNTGQDWERSFVQGLVYSRVVIFMVSAKALNGIKTTAIQRQDNVLADYECAILQSKLKGIPVVPLFVANAEIDETTDNPTFVKFELKDMNPADFPQVPHVRGTALEAIVNDFRKALPAHETTFLESIASTIQQIGKLDGLWLNKRGTDSEELDQFLVRMMEVLEP